MQQLMMPEIRVLDIFHVQILYLWCVNIIEYPNKCWGLNGKKIVRRFSFLTCKLWSYPSREMTFKKTTESITYVR